MQKKRGGKRLGAGRPKGTGKYGEKTKVMRVPVSKIKEVTALIQKNEEKSMHVLGDTIASLQSAICQKNLAIPLFSTSVQAGLPEATDDHMTGKLDLNQHLIENPQTTFFIRVSGDSMINAGIYEGDLLIVDRSLQAKSGNIVVAILNGEMTVKRLFQTQDRVVLYPENTAYPAIEITEEIDFQIWGVVCNAIRYVV